MKSVKEFVFQTTVFMQKRRLLLFHGVKNTTTIVISSRLLTLDSQLSLKSTPMKKCYSN